MAKRPANTPRQKTAAAKDITPGINTQSGRGTAFMTLIGVMLFAAVLYWPALKNGFTNWDDDVYVTANENLVFDANNLKVLATKQIAGNFHPLTMWSLAWDRGSDARKAPDPQPFHRSNLWLHLLNTALVFWLVRRLNAGTLVAGITALFFAIHPMHVESVAWVSGRKDLLFAAFFLGGLISFSYTLQRQKPGLWMLTFVLFLLSCLSKPAAIVFPGALWLVHWYLQPEAATRFRNLVYLLPFLAVSAIFAYVTLVYQKQIGAVDEQFSFVQRSLFASYAFVAYLWKMILPVNLSAFHPAPVAGEPLTWLYYTAPVAALAVLAAMWYTFSRQRQVFFALAFYLLNLILVLGFIKIGSAVMAERYTYLSYCGLFMLMGWGAVRFSEKGGLAKVGTWAVMAAFAGYWAWTTSRQIGVWRNSETLWTQIVGQYPTEKCLSYRGYERYLEGKWDKALEDFDRAYALNPKNETTVHIRAICLEKSGKTADAIKAYEAYEQQFAPNADVLFQFANLLNTQKRPAEAIPRFEQSLSLNPKNIDAWNNLANAYFDQKQPQKAEDCFTKTLEINPAFIPGLNNRGAVRLTLGKWDQAIADFNRSIALNPDQSQTYRYRAMCYDHIGKQAEAAADRAAAEKQKTAH